MLFAVGNLYVEQDEPIFIGDPGYAKAKPKALVRYNQSLVTNLVFDDDLQDFTYDKDNALARFRNSKRVEHGILHYHYLGVYVNLEKDQFFNQNPRATYFMLWNDLDKYPEVDKCRRKKVGRFNVDSGTASFIPFEMMEKWTDPSSESTEDDNDYPRYEKNDYEAATSAAIYNQIYAGTASRHTKFNATSEPEGVTSRVFTSRTHYGDGSFDVYELLSEFEGEDIPMGVLIDFIGIYSDDPETREEAEKFLTGKLFEEV